MLKGKARKELWSFNGAKFDNILLIANLMKSSNNYDIWGTNTNIKMTRYKKVYFYDMMLIY